ncbi:MAG: SRPBCC domain-containing protein [Pseudonocardiaceae bacterium]
MDRGTYLEHDGRPAVRFQRTYPHPIERVWAAVTEPDELSHWFPCAVQIEPRRATRLVVISPSWHVCRSRGAGLNG